MALTIDSSSFNKGIDLFGPFHQAQAHEVVNYGPTNKEGLVIGNTDGTITVSSGVMHGLNEETSEFGETHTFEKVNDRWQEKMPNGTYKELTSYQGFFTPKSENGQLKIEFEKSPGKTNLTNPNASMGPSKTSITVSPSGNSMYDMTVSKITQGEGKAPLKIDSYYTYNPSSSAEKPFLYEPLGDISEVKQGVLMTAHMEMEARRID